MPSVKCAKPHEWNIGAAIIVVLARRAAGSVENSAAAGSSDSGCLRLRALRRAGRARGEDDHAALLARAATTSSRVAAARSGPPAAGPRARSSPSGQAMKRLRPHAGVADQLGELLVVDDRHRLLALDDVGDLRRRERRVQVQRVGAELRARDRGLDEAAVVAAQDRDAVALADARRRRSAWASALVRSWTSRKVSVPSSSMIARVVGVADGRRRVAGRGRRAPAAQGVEPRRSSLSGRVGRTSTPASTSVLAVSRRCVDGSRGRSRPGPTPTACPAASDRQAVAVVDERADVAGAARVQEHVALADARLLG